MSGTVYWVQNAAYATTAAPVKIATGTAVKTMLQIGVPATTVNVRIVEWGCSFDTPATASIINVELFGNTVAATGGTAITPATYNDLGSVPSLCTGGTGTTCWGPSTEGTVATYRPFDLQTVVPPAQYVKQWPLGREPQSAAGTFVRVRVTATVTCNMYAYVQWEE